MEETLSEHEAAVIGRLNRIETKIDEILDWIKRLEPLVEQAERYAKARETLAGFLGRKKV